MLCCAVLANVSTFQGRTLLQVIDVHTLSAGLLLIHLYALPELGMGQVLYVTYTLRNLK